MANKNHSTDLTELLAEQVREYLPQDPYVIAGVSGGADSMLLMYLLSRLGLRCFVSHINYGTRKGESDREQELVEQMAFEWGFECHTVQLDPSQAEGNFQNWARDQRYQVFHGLLGSENADAIAVAHHKDDQTETMVQKIFRGSSLSSWSAMNIWDPPIFRPMLPFTKEEILRFCEDHAIPYLTDSSNERSGYARNWLRNEWFVEMDRLFPGWRNNLERIEQQSRAFDDSTRYILKQLVSDDKMPNQAIEELSEPLKGELWRKLMLSKGVKPSMGNIEEILKLEQSQPGTTLRIGALQVIRERDGISLKEDPGVELQTASSLSKTTLEKGMERDGYVFSISDQAGTAGSLWMNANRLKFPLQLRTWQPGDRFRPFGMRGHQKVSDHLTNRKVSGFLKDRALVLCEEDGTIVALLYPEKINGQIGCIDDRFKADKETTNYLIIRTDV